MRTSKRLDKFPEYIFSKLGRKKKEIEKETGKTVLDLSMGTPDYPPSPKYIEKLVEFIQSPDAHLYPGFSANKNFSQGIIEFYKKRFNVKLEENELFPLLGGKDGVSHLPLALIDQGDEILIPDPGYPGYAGPALMFNAKPVFYNLNEKNNFKPDLSELERKITKRTKFIWINFPSNPTGQVITKEELALFVRFAQKKNIVLVYDNAYSEITFDGFVAPSILEVPGAKDVILEIGSFSKSHSFAGLRIGWIAGNKELIRAFAKVKSQIDSGMATPLQNLAGFALLNPDLKWKEKMLRDYERRRDILAQKLKTLGLTFSLPKGGLYIWAQIPKRESDSEKYCLELLEKRHILLAPGTAFGNNGRKYIRACFSTNIDNIDNYF